ncbi:DUF4352 domain-containing protein [Cellulomonas denverensis]|uniref:DUF4352 domain-containing protein n=2 Tax=Cellulomonas denverensis TaxID=264297 RepID=A0A7X6KXA5_9CELL|nr:DUF4352 domain-containing protein [Cellulomonas denverensis]
MPGQPYGQPAPAPKRSWFARHKVLTGLGAAVVLVIVIAIAGGGGGGDDKPAASAPTADAPAAEEPAAEEPAAEEPAAEQPAEPELPGIGATAADGKFSFVVTGVETGVPQVGSQYLTSDAQGQYVLVHLTVTNSGTEPQYLFASSQEATDTQGRTHSVDTTATLYAGETDVWASQINPGNQISGTLVFDIPADATLETVTLHDSPFSGGVQIRLG